MKHYRKNHGDLPPELKNCDFLSCPHCPEACRSKQSLKKHIATLHNGGVPDKISCGLCNQEFKTRGYLLQHYKAFHKDIPPEMKDKEQYICEDCGSVFLSRLCLKNHQSYVHMGKKGKPTAAAPKPTKCPLCDKVVSSQRILTNHIKSQHEKNTPFKCDECTRSFIGESALRTHKKAVHERVKCDICSQEICNSFLLKRHKASAHGQIPANSSQCQLCPMIFMTKKNLEKHFESKHKELI